jgi:lactaldehyde dehydrogenase
MQMLIDSEWCDAEEGMVREVKNPASGETIDKVPESSNIDVERAVAAAQQAKKRMYRTPAHKRASVLFNTANAMEEKSEELARMLATENGKPIRQTREEIAAAVRIFRGFGEEAKRVFGRASSMDMVPGMERHFATTIRQPVGTVAAIIPFNYPVELYSHKAAAALAAGNAVIVKPPSDCPLTLLKIAELLESAGIPQGAHQVVTGPGSVVGDYLAMASGIQLITLTGSTEVGKRISRLASESLKRVHLELGGNDAQIVMKDADLELAAESVVLGRLARGNGQICCAVKRIFVENSVYENFAEILTTKTQQLRVGDPLSEDTDVGPLINEAAAENVMRYIEDAKTGGAKVCAGGSRSGAFVEPTVLTNLGSEARLLYEENFGPVAPLIGFDTIDEAIERANDSPYGLQASVFTNDITKALNISHELDVGGVIINWSSAVRVENLPFGGVKMTGHGRESIHDTLNEMTEIKTILFYDALSVFQQEDTP